MSLLAVPPARLPGWFRVPAGILGPLCALLLFLTAPLAPPASAGCEDYGRYWHVVSRVPCGPNGGLDNAVIGHYAFVTENVSFFSVMDIQDPANPQLAARIPTADTSRALAVSGTHAYDLEGFFHHRCMEVIDISDPVNPVIDATLDTPYGNIMDIAASGSYAYIAAYPEVVIVDVSNPTQPVVVGGIPLEGGVAEAVAVFGQYLCIGVRNYGYPPAAGLCVADVSHPGSPVIVGFIRTAGWPEGLAVAGNHAFVTSYIDAPAATLDVIDLSDPAHPALVSSVPFSSDTAEQIVVSDTMAYVTLSGNSTGLQAIDISDPRNPALRGLLLGAGGSGSLSGDYLYLGGLTVVDVRNPTDPSAVSMLPLDAWYAEGSGSHAYVTTGGSFQVVDVADPFAPRVVGSLDLERGGPMAIVGTNAYVIQRPWAPPALLQVDVSDPTAPTVVGGMYLPDQADYLAMGAGLAYLSLGRSGLLIVDCSSWSVIATLDTPGWTGGIALSGSYAYIADNYAGVQVVDVSNPYSPRTVANVPCGFAYDLTVSGHYLYVRGGQIFVYDISQPEAPQNVSSFNESGDGSIQVRGSIAYVRAYGGVEMLDVSDPTHLSILGFISIPGNFRIGVDPEGALLYVAQTGTGLDIFWPQCAPVDAVEDPEGAGRPAAVGAGLRIVPNPSVRGTPTRIRLEMGAIGVPIDALDAPGGRFLKVSIYDATGRRVRTLLEAAVGPGPFEVTWDGLDEAGHQVATGVYLVRAAMGEATRAARVVVVQ